MLFLKYFQNRGGLHIAPQVQAIALHKDFTSLEAFELPSISSSISFHSDILFETLFCPLPIICLDNN